MQNIYRWKQGGDNYFVAEATDSGSVFDVGTFFEVPRSGRSRTELRHAVFQKLSSQDAWSQLTIKDFEACLSSEEAGRLWRHELLERLRGQGASTHHIGMIDPVSGHVTSEFIPTNIVMIREFPVIKPTHFSFGGKPAWDYHAYQVERRKLLAIEHIFRLGSPAGSSIEQRYRAAVESGDNEHAAHILEAIGLDQPISPWGRFSSMVYDCSTKYEDHDRYVNWQEAVHISGVDHEVFEGVIDLLSFCTVMVRKLFSELSFVLWDIKWEAAVDDEEIVVVDTVDHDSIRITSDSIRDGRHIFTHFNKQAIRDYYRILHPAWLDALNDAKRISESDPFARSFRDIYDDGVKTGLYPPIPELDHEFASIQADKYEAVAAGVSGRRSVASDGVIQQLVDQELAYYGSRGYVDEFLQEVSLPSEDSACA